MNAVVRSNGVNWSAVVHPLFEAEVTVSRAQSRRANCGDTKASRIQNAAQRQQLIQGRFDGREWVEYVAEYKARNDLRKTPAAIRARGIDHGSSSDAQSTRSANLRMIR
jgi:hypothetical protein